MKIGEIVVDAFRRTNAIVKEMLQSAIKIYEYLQSN